MRSPTTNALSRHMRLAQLLIPLFTTLMLTYGCAKVENKVGPAVEAIATSPEIVPADKSLTTLPKRGLKKQKSQQHYITPPHTVKQHSVKSLIGLPSTSILLFLGPPQFKRLDSPAQIWQYRQDNCILYLFLYPSHNGLAVSHLETLDHQHKHISRVECFDNIMLATQKRPR